MYSITYSCSAMDGVRYARTFKFGFFINWHVPRILFTAKESSCKACIKSNIKRLWQSKIWGFHGSEYEECGLLGYKNPGRTSQETRYTSVTKSRRLMLCRMWGFHCCDYEECRLLGYRNPVHTPQEKHYVSTTETSRLMPYKTWGFHGSNYEYSLLWCEAVCLL
jgi:hypothetical protein